MIADSVAALVESEIVDYQRSRLSYLTSQYGQFVIKFVSSEWAAKYVTPQQLKVSTTPALTWGTATYVTPLAFPLSSALYGRIGLVSEFDPWGWRVFDATRPSAQAAYLAWVQSQPSFADLLFTT